MLKTLKLFLIFSFCIPSISLAWSGSCYSPVQLAAFMSKPKKSSRGISQSSVSGIKSKIRSLERALDKAEGDLQDSLDRNKLKAKPSTVAGDIRDYIEDGQDGWDCSKGGQSSLFFFPSLIPKAYANPLAEVIDEVIGNDDGANTLVEGTSKSSADGKNEGKQNKFGGESNSASPVTRESGNTGSRSKSKSSVRNCSALHPAMELKGNRCVCKAGYKRTAANQCIKKTESGNTGSGAESKSAVQRQKAKKAGSEAESQPAVQRQKAGKAGSEAESQSTVQRQKSPQEKSCVESGGTWKNDSCSCPETKPRLSGGQCRPCLGNTEWDSAKKRCIAPPKELMEKDKCQGYWNEGANKCCPNEKRLVHAGQCVSLKEKQCIKQGNNWKNDRCETKEEKSCVKSGGTWPDDSCSCPTAKPRLSGGQCRPCLGNTEWDSAKKRCIAPPKELTEKDKCQGYWNEGANKCCPNEKRLVHAGQCVSLKEKQCIKQGNNWKNDRCETKEEKSCVKSGGTWQDDSCSCPETKPRLSGGQCRPCLGNMEWDSAKKRCIAPPKELTEKDKCQGYWNEGANKCCPNEKRLVHAGQCVSLKEKQCENKGEGWTWKNGKCVKCPDWKKHSGFKSNGKVSSNFCDEYAQDKGDCKRALSHLHRRAKQLKRLQDQLESVESRLLEASLNPDEDSTTEAGGVCFDCLKRIIKSSQPSTGQVVGQSLGLLMGAGLSIAGYKVGKNAQTHANMMRIQEGYPSLYDGFSLTGMGAGYPYMANSLYGMTRAATPVGGWACSPTISPYGHSYNHGYGYGYNMGYY